MGSATQDWCDETERHKRARTWWGRRANRREAARIAATRITLTQPAIPGHDDSRPGFLITLEDPARFFIDANGERPGKVTGFYPTNDLGVALTMARNGYHLSTGLCWARAITAEWCPLGEHGHRVPAPTFTPEPKVTYDPDHEPLWLWWAWFRARLTNGWQRWRSRQNGV